MAKPNVLEPLPLITRGKQNNTITPRRGPKFLNASVVNTSSAAGATQVSLDRPLTDKQKAFTSMWARGESIRAASIRAGFGDGDSYAYRLVKQPNVLAFYHIEKVKYEDAARMSRKKVMDGMLEAIEMAKLTSEPMAMVAGWREVGKMCGYYAPVESRVKIDITGNIVLDRLNGMSDAELLRLIQAPAMESLLALDDGDDQNEPDA